MVITKLKKILNINAFAAFIIVTITLIFYCFKYYKQGELVFLQNEFGFFVGFALLVILAFAVIVLLNCDLKKELKIANEAISKANETISKMSNMMLALIERQDEHNYSNTELHKNTRSIILACEKENHNTPKERKYV